MPTAGREPAANLCPMQLQKQLSRVLLSAPSLSLMPLRGSILLVKRKQTVQNGGQTQADSLAEVTMEMKDCVLTVGIPAHIFCQMIFIQLRGVC